MHKRVRTAAASLHQVRRNLSARQVHIWLREEGIELPIKSRQVRRTASCGDCRPTTSCTILTNPIYAGAYAFGRTKSRVSVEGGRKHIRRGVQKPMAEWEFLIKDHHAAYITWDEFERTLEVISANNATSMSSALALAEQPVKAVFRDGEWEERGEITLEAEPTHRRLAALARRCA